jgi:ribokinase
MSILVIGSFVMDLVTKTNKVPNEGETVLGLSFNQYPGGKGANQAIQAARLGAKVYMSGCLGFDDFGKQFLSILKKENINSDFVYQSDKASTGTGSITLDSEGQNRIIVVPGANHEYQSDYVDGLSKVMDDVNIIMAQLELRLDVIESVANLAARYNKVFILNPAPACKLSDSILSKVTYLTPNETELEILTNLKNLDTIEAKIKACQLLLKKGVKNVIVTLGSDGALLVNENQIEHVKGFKVKAIDTVAAGDSFNGAIAYMLEQSKSILESIKFANAVGAITVTKQGAIPSLPNLDEVNYFILINNK